MEKEQICQKAANSLTKRSNSSAPPKVGLIPPCPPFGSPSLRTSGKASRLCERCRTRRRFAGDSRNLKADLDKVTRIRLYPAANQLTDVTGLEKLTNLKELWLQNNSDLTKAQIDEL